MTPESGDDDLGELLLSLIAEMKTLNLRTAALREILQDHLGISDAQFADAHAKVTAAAHLDLDKPPRAKH
jgi:hypothetical protein